MKKSLIALFFFLTVFLTGCENAENRGAEQPETVSSEETVIPEETAGPEETADSEGAVSSEETAALQEKLLYPEDQKSCVIQEDEDYFYICGALRLVKIDKETGESEVLWENTELCDNYKLFIYFQGSGLLIGDKIYFVEQWAEGEKALSVIRTDGTGHERVAEYVGRSMLLQDGILYVANRDSTVCYKVYEDGTLSEEISREESTKLEYYDNGYRVLFAPESIKKFGYAIYRYNKLEEKYKLTKVIPETGELLDMSRFGNYYEASNSRYLLISSYGEGSYLVDAETLEGREFVDCSMPDSGVTVITMDEDYVYTVSKVSEEGQVQYVYEKISPETGERSVICKREQSKVWQYDIMDTVVKNGYLYYVKEVDYNLYLMRRNVEDPSKEEILGKAIFDSGISEVGTMEVYQEELNHKVKNLTVNMEINLKWLKVDDRFPGADKINKYLAEDQRQNIDYEKDLLEIPMEWDEEESEAESEDAEEEEWTFYRYYTSEFSEISYFDNHYLSFYQSEDDYQGGMHGMLYRIGYTFDLQTGARLVLEDIIASNEEELKDIVTKYFEKEILANPDPGYYWSDAPDTVREWTDLESDFYLTDKGIRFYFGPYALASFAAGFQEITVPYEEFEMKIPVGNVSEATAGMEP
ncbi:MAG: DUF3298 domain-containing protein [Acetatifactor sp.]|nr:DUF3298 domain-containing protein [Acetatifactor sp.]